MAQQHAEECNEVASDITISFPMEDIDEASSEVVSLNTPLRHEVIQFDWLHCKYSKQGKNNFFFLGQYLNLYLCQWKKLQ